MIQHIARSIYNCVDRLFGGGTNGKIIKNGRKLVISFSTILLFFMCAIIGSIWFPALLTTITNVVFAGTIVSLVTAYVSSNVLSKKSDTSSSSYPPPPPSK